MLTLADEDQFLHTTNGSAATFQNERVKNLNSIFNDRREIAFVLEVTTGAVAPGVNATTDFFFATPDVPGYTPAQLATAAEQYTLALPDTANTKAIYVVPNVRCIGPYVTSWFGFSAMDSGATVEIKRRLRSNPSSRT